MTDKKRLPAGISLLLLVVTTASVTWAIEMKSGKVIPPTGYKAAPVSSLSRSGELIYKRNECDSCHSIGGKGGCLGPPLDGIGGRRSEAFIKSRITKSSMQEEKFESQVKSELMSHSRISPSQANAVAKYLLTLPEPAGGFGVIGHTEISGKAEPQREALQKTPLAVSIKRGRDLVTSKGCLACHTLGDFGGSFAPKFDGIGTRLEAGAIKKQFRDAELLTLGANVHDPEAVKKVMPMLNLSDQDMDDLTNYLMTIK